MKTAELTTREKLIESAIRLLEDKRGEDLSLREVAKASGLTHNAPYRHFADKEDLLAALAAVGFRKLSKAMRQEEVGLAGMNRAYMKVCFESPELMRLMFNPRGECPTSGAEAQSAAAEAYGLLLETITQEFPGLNEMERHRKAVEAWSLIHGFASMHRDGTFVFLPEEALPTPESLAKSLKSS